ncbi:hypothetical protein CPB83DRAFT_942190 [Crepidotus variabilis]|uniref:Uncharacterized protein n=1 Tax=Crepidotus variabilis TaxID=179855 RepID=A0A9P6JLT7_9AGAR|nr:hypothetical protein CPB83DRAFT_942190 [Crepidotus variabilis]
MSHGQLLNLRLVVEMWFSFQGPAASVQVNKSHAPLPRLYSPPSLPFNSMPPVASVAPPQASVTYLLPANLRSLMVLLVKSEVLNIPAASAPTAQVTSTSASSKQEGASAVKDVNTREYGKISLSETTTFVGHSTFTYLNSSFNFRQRRRIVELLYEQQTSIPSLKELKDHLDMHIRQNSKVDQGRGHSRSWFTSLEDWLDDVSGSEKGKGPAYSSSLTSTKVDNAKR